MIRPWPAVLFLACAALPTGAPLHAGTGVERCVAADGSTLYTDKACRAMGATSTPVSAALAGRILEERSREERFREERVRAAQAFGDPLLHGGAAAGNVAAAVADYGGAYADAAMPLATAAPTAGRRSVAAGCARSPTQLQMDLRGALALGDVNRIAESYHWVGVSPRSAARIMDRLAMMARRQVDDMRYFNASIGDAGAVFADAGASGATGGVMQVMLVGKGGPGVIDFDVERYKGCWFVRF